MTNMEIALFSLAAFAIFMAWQFLKSKADVPYSEEPTEAGRQILDDDIERRSRRMQ